LCGRAYIYAYALCINFMLYVHMYIVCLLTVFVFISVQS